MTVRSKTPLHSSKLAFPRSESALVSPGQGSLSIADVHFRSNIRLPNLSAYVPLLPAVQHLDLTTLVHTIYLVGSNRHESLLNMPSPELITREFFQEANYALGYERALVVVAYRTPMSNHHGVSLAIRRM
jgi:hypothetical protein